MLVKGIDLSTLPDQFNGCVAGRTLILDGDGPAYVAATTVKRLDTAVRRFQQLVLTQMFLTKAQDCRVHLTASNSKKAGRYLVKAVKPYQGNRDSKAKPPLLEPLRHAVTLRENWLPEYTVHLHHDIEADDAMIQDAHRLKEDGIIWSDDKDLMMTPYPYWRKDRGIVEPSEPNGWIELKSTDSGTIKLIGRGSLFFWGQMLMGDTADNIKGILTYDNKLCGPSAAYNALKHFKCQHAAANAVLDAYREINQNPLPEGYLLWLLRWPGDSFMNYLSELSLSDKNKEYIRECGTRDWFSSEVPAEY
jgi:DNA polymerase-1